MKSVLVALILIALAAAAAVVWRRQQQPRKHKSQFFRHTFDESGAGNMPEPLPRDPLK